MVRRFLDLLNCGHHFNHVTRRNIKGFRFNKIHSIATICIFEGLVTNWWHGPTQGFDLRLELLIFGTCSRLVFFYFLFRWCFCHLFLTCSRCGCSFVQNRKLFNCLALNGVVVIVLPNIFNHHLEAHLKKLFNRLLFALLLRRIDRRLLV